MIKTKKGQLIVLDILFAVVIILLMFFMLLKLAEIQMYKTNTDKSIEKLNNIGTLAYEKTLNNSQINCKVVDSKNSFYLPGTINTTTSITKAKLGIPRDYNCSFKIDGLPTGCNDTFYADQNLESYNIDFNVVTCSGNFTKAQFVAYTTGTATPTQKVATLKIWRG